MTTSVDAKQLLKKMEQLSKAAANKVGKKAITEGAKLMAKAIKKQIPSRQKSARKAIGYSFKRPRSGKYKNVIFAKAGAGAGMKKAKRQKKNAEHKFNRKSKRKGVGITASNIHWLLAGTDERHTGTKRVGARRAGAKNRRRVIRGRKPKRTGRMKKSGYVQKAQSIAGKQVETTIKDWLHKGIMKELSK